MKILRIFDVSTYIHAGMVNRHSYLLPSIANTADGFRERRLPTGGLSMIWNMLYNEYGKCDMVFCMDLAPTKKILMNENYKANREHNRGVSKANDIVYTVLKDCGFTVLREDGYEADDFIYSLVQEYKSVYDHIYVYTADSDLYFLVDDNISIEPSTSRAKVVNKQNYTYTVRKDKYTPYNALTLYKIMYGDKSDNIAPLSPDLCAKIKALFEIPGCKEEMANKEFVIDILTTLDPVAARQASLVFPLDVEVPETFGVGDKIRIAEWGSAMRNKLWYTGRPASESVQSVIEEMADAGLSED